MGIRLTLPFSDQISSIEKLRKRYCIKFDADVTKWKIESIPADKNTQTISQYV